MKFKLELRVVDKLWEATIESTDSEIPLRAFIGGASLEDLMEVMKGFLGLSSAAESMGTEDWNRINKILHDISEKDWAKLYNSWKKKK